MPKVCHIYTLIFISIDPSLIITKIRENSYENVQPKRSGILPKWNAEIERYETGVLISGEIERMVFLRSNHLMDYKYGKKPIIEETIAVFISKYYIVALLMGILYFVAPFILIKMMFLKSVYLKVMECLFPKPGNGPSMKKMLNVEWKHYIFIESIKNKNKKIRVDVKIFGDYMYYNTAKLLVEQGICCVIQRKNDKDGDLKYGFVTPSVAFAEKLVQRMNNLKEFEIVYKMT